MKRKQPTDTHCRNCETLLKGRYCHQCGQDVYAGTEKSVFRLSYIAIENAFSLDNKIFVTLKRLLFYPGYLSKEYINGRIVSYVHPAKLFWFIALVLFTITAWTVSKAVNVNRKEINQQRQEIMQDVAQLKYADSTIISKIIEKHTKDTNKSSSYTITGDWDGLDDIDKYSSQVLGYLPYASPTVVPAFAFLLLLFFRRKHFAYVDHFVFALHFHSFILILFILLLLLNLLFPNVSFSTPASIAITFIPYVYFTVGVYHLYKPKVAGLILKPFFISVIYFVVLLVATIVLTLALIFIITGENPLN